ncbi:MAG: hypothetical protein AAGU19_20175 [Prolixibacteraceae bacterium]
MSVTVAYEVLFEVKILHHYFLNRAQVVFDRMPAAERAALMLQYDCREFLEIRPTDSCGQLLRSHRCIFKQTASGFVVALRAEEDPDDPVKHYPFIPFNDDDCFAFSVRLTDVDFWNYTALPFTGNSGKMFVFSNRRAAVPIGFPSLTVNPAVYQAGSEHLPGDILGNKSADPDKLFIAKVRTKKKTSVASDWLEEKKADGFPMQYAGENDRITVWGSHVNYSPGIPGLAPELTLVNETGQVLTVPFESLPGNPPVFQLNLARFPEGIYTLHAQSASPAGSEQIRFFLHHGREAPFAMIHLTPKSNVAAYRITGNQGELRSPVYEIRFRNRATHWRYIGKNFNQDSVTPEPLPLTRFGLVTDVSVPGKDGTMIDDLPNPSNTMVKTEALSGTDEKKYCSEIHILY